MFGFLVRWRKTSKCKSVVKQLQYRLKLLKNKKYAISTHLRQDIAQLLRTGERNRALHRAQQLFLDENLMSVYDLLLHFSDLVLLHVSRIRRKQRELADGVKEAVSTLVFASARCGNVPELRTLRQLIGERFGQSFLETSLQLLPGNFVNFQIVDKLCLTSVPEDVTSKLLGEIAAEHNIRLQVLALEYTPQIHNTGIKNGKTEQEEKEVKSSDLTENEQEEEEKEEEEVFKFTVTDAEMEEKHEGRRRTKLQSETEVRSVNSKASKERIVFNEEDDCIEEEVEAKDHQRVFKFTERKRSRSRSGSSSITKEMECWRSYYSKSKSKGKKRRKRKESECYHHHVVYNVFTMCGEHKEEEEERVMMKEGSHSHSHSHSHVHHKLPDYDHIAAHFTALRRHHHSNNLCPINNLPHF